MNVAALEMVQPHDIRAEEELLGAVLTTTTTLGAVQAEVALRPDHFYNRDHGAVYAAALALAERGEPTDEITVTAELRRRGRYEDVGREKLERLTLPASPHNALHYAEIVRQKARWRQRYAAGQLIQQASHAEDDEGFAEGQAILAEGLSHHNAVFSEEKQRDLVYSLLEGKSAAEFYWPVEKLNRLQSGGMRRGDLIVLSGYTNEGKSHFADQILDQNVKHDGVKVCLYDNEMDPTERAARRATRLAGVNYGRLLDGKLTPEEQTRLMKHLNADRSWPIVDMAGWSVEEVCHHIRQYRWDLVVVDILHNFPFADERELSASVARLKAAAKQAKCCVLLVAHVNRGGVERGKRRRPVRSDLRWSGDIENLADVVCFVYREQDPETYEALPEGFVYFDKCRRGKLGGEKVRFNGNRLRFEVAA